MKLSEFINKYGDYEVTDELMDMVKDEWKPKNSEQYFYIESRKAINSDTWWGYDTDNFKLEKRNVYRTLAEAEKALEMYEFCRERSFKPDWNDGIQNKYFLFLDCSSKKAKIDGKYISRHFAPFYYPNRETIEEIINKYSFEELEKYYGRV